ncbi:hypothetical protein JW823_09060 [bacterium]|nr:hypothetical protein [candidate division CSSED10-310 bacterium]
MKKNVKKLIRDAHFEPASKKLDERMATLFVSDQDQRDDDTISVFVHFGRWRMAVAGLATVLIFISGAVFMFKDSSRIDQKVTRSGVGTSIDNTQQNEVGQVLSGDVSMLFADEKVVLRRVYTTSRGGEMIVMRSRPVTMEKDENNL